MAEGRLAAAAILHEVRGEPIAGDLRSTVRAERRAADAMLRAFVPLPGLAELAQPDTIACRCEDVTVAGLRAAARLHGGAAKAIKMGCRAGMGPCQARICGPSLQTLAGPGAGGWAMDKPVTQVPLKAVCSETILQAPASD